MAKLVYALHQSLDGFVDHREMGPPAEEAFRHFIAEVDRLAGMLYGRGMYEVMRYWDEDLSDWDDADRDYAAVWRRKPKWVVSRSLSVVGPNATLITEEVEESVRRLKEEIVGEIGVGGPHLASTLTAAGLIDEYQIYLRPVILGTGNPYFPTPPPPLRLAASETIAGDVIRLTYVPA